MKSFLVLLLLAAVSKLSAQQGLGEIDHEKKEWGGPGDYGEDSRGKRKAVEIADDQAQLIRSISMNRLKQFHPSLFFLQSESGDSSKRELAEVEKALVEDDLVDHINLLARIPDNGKSIYKRFFSKYRTAGKARSR